jgi:hypothetical protein
VILGLINKTPIKCKIAKSIRIPIVCNAESCDGIRLTIEDDEMLDLFILTHKDYETMFYVVNDVIRFINRSYEEYSRFGIFRLIDYKSDTYNFVEIDKEKYKLIKYNVKPRQFIKSPSGDLYFIVQKTFLEIEKKCYKILTINNLTKGKVLFSFIEEDHYFIFQKGQKIFPTIIYTLPIINSFIVIMRIDDNNKLEKTSIYLVDLVEETVEEIEYDLKGYVIELIYNVEDYLLDLLDEVSRYYNLEDDDAEYFTPEKIFQTSKIEVRESSYCELVKYKGEIPTYNNCRFEITISLENNILYADCAFKMECDILLLAYVEGNELNIIMTSGEGGYIKVCEKSGVRYDIPSEVVLLQKKYYVPNKYNINTSQLYSVTSLFGDYLIIDRNVYKLDNGRYRWLYYMSAYDTARFAGVNITYRSDDVFAFILPNRVRKNLTIKEDCMLRIDPTYDKQLYLSYKEDRKRTIKMIDYGAINKIMDLYKEQKVIIRFDEYIREIDLNKLLKHVAQKLYNEKIKYDNMYCIYYFIEETCNLYLFILLTSHNYGDITGHFRLVIVEYKVLGQVSDSKIIFLSEAYEYEVEGYSQLKIKNQHLLLQEIILKMLQTKGKKTYLKDLTIYSLIRYLIDMHRVRNARDKIVKYGDLVGYLYEISKRDYAGLFLYDGELLIEDKKTFMIVKDIKFNRKANLKQVFIFYPENGETYALVDKHNNILIYKLYIRDVPKDSEYSKFRLIIKVSEMELVQTIKTIKK